MFFWDQHKTITSCYALLAKSVCEKYQLTQMEYDILMFLHNNPQHKTTADMVRIRKSTKSHVSASLQTLERKGLILRTQSAANKRRIEIVLLERAAPIVADGISAQKAFAQHI